MLIYGRQRRHRHLISPTRHGCTTHSEVRYLQVLQVTKSILLTHSVSIMMRIFYIDWQQHWKYDRTMNIGANAHVKRVVSTKQSQLTYFTSVDSWASSDIGEGGTLLQCIYYLCRILISRPPRVFRRFKRRSCLLYHWFKRNFLWGKWSLASPCIISNISFNIVISITYLHLLLLVFVRHHRNN